MSLKIKKFVEKKAFIRTTIVNYLDGENLENDFNIHKYLDELKSQEDGIDLKELLNFMNNIIDNHHKSPEIWCKIEEIINYFKEDIKQNFSNYEIFQMFINSKKILDFLFENKIIEPDESVIDILTKPSYNDYFQQVIGTYYTGKLFDDNDSKEKRKCGENDSKISQLIRDDLAGEFVQYVNFNKYPLDSKITRSDFETNPLLNKREPTIIEYAAFFGSIQIVRYLKMNNVKLTPSLWEYSIHSNNPQMIHLLEEFDVKLDEKTYEKCILVAIQCHHNNIAKYFLEQINQNKCYFHHCLKFDNYEMMPIDSDSYSKFDLEIDQISNYIKYDYDFFDLLYKESYLDINYEKDNKTLLSFSIEKKDIKLMKFLLLNPKINPNYIQKICKKKGDVTLYANITRLLKAVKEENIEFIKLLLECPNTNPNAVLRFDIYDKDGYKYNEITALSMAIEMGNAEIVKILLSDEKTIPNSKLKIDGKEKTELTLALEKDNDEIIELLLNNPKIDINLWPEKYEEKISILFQAVEEENIKLIKHLLKCSKIDPNVIHTFKKVKNNVFYDEDKTPLLIAIEKENIEMIELLLKNPNINPNIIHSFSKTSKNIGGHYKKKTALSIAIKKENIKIIELLLEYPKTEPNHVLTFHKIGNNIYETEEKTELLLAIEKGNDKIIQLLFKNPRINPNIIFKDKHSEECTILSTAVEEENIELIKLLLNCSNIDIDTKIKKTVEYNGIYCFNIVVQV